MLRLFRVFVSEEQLNKNFYPFYLFVFAWLAHFRKVGTQWRWCGPQPEACASLLNRLLPLFSCFVLYILCNLDNQWECCSRKLFWLFSCNVVVYNFFSINNFTRWWGSRDQDYRFFPDLSNNQIFRASSANLRSSVLIKVTRNNHMVESITEAVTGKPASQIIYNSEQNSRNVSIDSWGWNEKP